MIDGAMVSKALEMVYHESQENYVSKEVFTKVENSRKKRKALGAAGKAETTGLEKVMARPEAIHIQIYNVHPSIDEQDIKDYISNKASSIKLKDIKKYFIRWLGNTKVHSYF